MNVCTVQLYLFARASSAGCCDTADTACGVAAASLALPLLLEPLVLRMSCAVSVYKIHKLMNL